ncbi:MAG: mechanosensitive ion channel family protein, partial [Lachnospiraceae bacterium]|nr:mechanosensitive ion channel family protein [Lachnospiraceae bacterium]
FYTRLTTPDGKVIVLPNGTLANSSLTNVTANPERRVDLKIGIAYSADLKRAKEVAEQVVRTQEHILQEQPVMVFVDSLGDSEVVLGVRCYVPGGNYWNVRWALTERLKLAFDENGIEIPFPQLDVHTKA